MTAYRNNLQRGDEVLEVLSRRRGTVANTPRETSPTAAVTFSGLKSPQPVLVKNLRLFVNGKPEDEPPCDGEAPAVILAPDRPARPAVDPAGAPSGQRESKAVISLKAQRDANLAEIASIEKRFKVLKAENEKLDRAVEIMATPTST